MSTPSSPNSTIMSDNSIDFLVTERPDKPFKCSECNWAFKYNKDLLRHKRVKHGMDNRALYHQAKAEAKTKWIPYNSNLGKAFMTTIRESSHLHSSYIHRIPLSYLQIIYETVRVVTGILPIIAYICSNLVNSEKTLFQKKGTFYQRCIFLYNCVYSYILAIYLPRFAYICSEIVNSEKGKFLSNRYICLYSYILAIYLPIFAYICSDLVISEKIYFRKKGIFYQRCKFLYTCYIFA